FSSRRRHTRSKRDWSSDVCSSDLQAVDGAALLGAARLEQLHHIGVLLRQLEGMLVQLVHGVELLIIRHAGQDGFHVKVHWITPRSEERRVGKECISRWWTEEEQDT